MSRLLASFSNEFESYGLYREEVIAGKRLAAITMRPLKLGRYAFAREYRERKAHGQIAAK